MATIRTIIKHYDAKNIGRVIANRALGKELKAANELRKQAAQEAYNEQMNLLGITPEKQAILASMLDLHPGIRCSVHIEKPFSSSGESGISLGYTPPSGSIRDVSDEEKATLPRYVHNDLIITDPAIVAKFREANKPYVALMNRYERFVEEVVDQIVGRSVGSVIKAWPEVERIVGEVMGVSGTSICLSAKPMVTPFADLLAKLALALPAPADTTESKEATVEAL